MKLRKQRVWAFYKASLDNKLKYFCIIIVLLILINWIGHWTAGNEGAWVLHSGDLGRIVLLSFFGMLPATLANMLVEATSTKGVLQINLITFVSTAALVLGMFAVLEPSGGITLRTIVIFLGIYAVLSVYSYFNAAVVIIRDNEVADEINKRLGEIHSNETHGNETHTDENETHTD